MEGLLDEQAAASELVAYVAELHQQEAGPAATVPVSYTHLRAHETVLDLVCRLLLEKKKTDRSET